MFQVGGNAGTALGPVLAALIVVPFGQPSIAWFASIAFVAILILWRIGRWYQPQIAKKKAMAAARHPGGPSSRRVMVALVVLVVLLFSKQVYMSSLSSYYTFYLIGKFGVSTQTAQIYLFMFLAATAAGVFFGGPLGDRFGRRYVIWFSILGALPFTLALPYVGLYGSAVLSVFIGFILASATPAIIVFAQELMRAVEHVGSGKSRLCPNSSLHSALEHVLVPIRMVVAIVEERFRKPRLANG